MFTESRTYTQCDQYVINYTRIFKDRIIGRYCYILRNLIVENSLFTQSNVINIWTCSISEKKLCTKFTSTNLDYLSPILFTFMIEYHYLL